MPQRVVSAQEVLAQALGFSQDPAPRTLAERQQHLLVLQNVQIRCTVLVVQEDLFPHGKELLKQPSACYSVQFLPVGFQEKDLHEAVCHQYKCDLVNHQREVG